MIDPIVLHICSLFNNFNCFMKSSMPLMMDKTRKSPSYAKPITLDMMFPNIVAMNLFCHSIKVGIISPISFHNNSYAMQL